MKFHYSKTFDPEFIEFNLTPNTTVCDYDFLNSYSENQLLFILKFPFTHL